MNDNKFKKFEQVKEIEAISLLYQRDLAQQLFTPIEHHSWAMLLNSSSQQHMDSRFDILVANPIATLVTQGKSTTITELGKQRTSFDDPFVLLHALQQKHLPDISIGKFIHCDSTMNDETKRIALEMLPFIGGAMGYFAYDLGRRIEKMPELAQHDLSLPDMAVGLYSWAVVVDHQTQMACIVGLEAAKAWAWLNQVPSSLLNNDFQLCSNWESNMVRSSEHPQISYQHKFSQIQAYLHSGDCYQVNLAQRFQAQYQGSEWQAYQKLNAYNSAPFSAFIRIEKHCILSVSPERFLELKCDQIETKPIKGTRPRDLDPLVDQRNAQELIQAEKDQAENLMIVDLLRNDIGRVAKPGSISVPKLFDIESFPAVHHLVSTIRATLENGYVATDLLRACFPGGSITGAPKIRAMEIIEELEPHRRSIYCGSIGYISRHGRMDTNIAIRTLVTEKNMIYTWAGGGIVADSQWEAEYQETIDKLSRILPVLSNSYSS